MGGGDSALEEATFLTRFARSVTVVHRRDALRASAIMQDRARANPKIRFAWDSVVTEVVGEDRVAGIRLQNTKTGEESFLEVSGIFVAIGHDPRSELFTGQLELDDEGYLDRRPAVDQDQDPGCVRRGRRGGPHLPAGRDRGRDRLFRGSGCRAVAGGPGRPGELTSGSWDCRDCGAAPK